MTNERKLLVKAVVAPHAYPWSKHVDLNEEEVLSILKKYKLDKEADRRKACLEVYCNIYMEALNHTSVKELKRALSKKINKSYLMDEMLNDLLRFSLLNTEDDLREYKLFFNNSLEGRDGLKYKYKLINWISSIVAYYYASEKNLTQEFLKEKVKERFNETYGNIELPDKIIGDVFYNKGYSKKQNISLFKYIDNREFKDIFNNFFGVQSSVDKKDKDDTVVKISKAGEEVIDSTANTETVVDSDSDDLTASILNLFDAIGDEFEEVEEVEEKAEVVEIDQTTDIEESVGGESVSKNNDLAEENRVSLSKDTYNKLLESGKDSEIVLFKKLASLKEGAVLSELYNSYKNINNISISNLEAVLSNFFSTLAVYGLETIELEQNIGDLVEVDTKDLLKEFIFTNPVDVDGSVKGYLEYYGWSYKGKQIVPMVVKPVKEDK